MRTCKSKCKILSTFYGWKKFEKFLFLHSPHKGQVELNEKDLVEEMTLTTNAAAAATTMMMMGETAQSVFHGNGTCSQSVSQSVSVCVCVCVCVRKGERGNLKRKI